MYFFILNSLSYF